MHLDKTSWKQITFQKKTPKFEISEQKSPLPHLLNSILSDFFQFDFEVLILKYIAIEFSTGYVDNSFVRPRLD